MSLDEFTRTTGSIKIADELLQTNVFSYNPRKQTITFKSRLVEAYVMENLQKFGMA